MENIVLVPWGIQVPVPYASLPKSLAQLVFLIVASGPFTRCRYSKTAPDTSSIIELTYNGVKGVVLSTPSTWECRK